MACLKIPPMASVSEQQQTFLIVICHAGDKSKKKKDGESGNFID